MKINAPSKIVFFLPRVSPEGPAKNAPKKAPPVKTETTAPVSAVVGLKVETKLSDAMAPAMTPRSYPYRSEPKDANTETRNWYHFGGRAMPAVFLGERDGRGGKARGQLNHALDIGLPRYRYIDASPTNAMHLRKEYLLLLAGLPSEVKSSVCLYSYRSVSTASAAWRRRLSFGPHGESDRGWWSRGGEW